MARSGHVASGVAGRFGGGRGIRTPGVVKPNGFQDRRNRPLCHPSGSEATGGHGRESAPAIAPLVRSGPSP